MLKSFSFKNYKAFREGKIEIKPITILLGANSVGKSSILQFLSMIQQTVNIDKKYKSALKLNGEYVSLGEKKNIFHNQKTNIPLEISFEIQKFDTEIIKQSFENTLDEILISLERAYSFLTEEHITKRRRISHNIPAPLPYPDVLKNIQSLKTKINNKIKKKKEKDGEETNAFLNKIMSHSRYSRNVSNLYSKKNKKILLELKHYKKTYDLLSTLSEYSNKPVTLSYQIIIKNNDFHINKIIIQEKEKTLLSYSHNIDGKKHQLYSEVYQQEIPSEYIRKFGNSIHFEKLNIRSEEIKTNAEAETEYHLFQQRARRKKYKIDENVFIKTIFKIFRNTIKNTEANFHTENINYVSPLRAFPKRYYFLDESNVSSSLNTINGNQLTEILKENKKIKRKVNDWLEKFQLKVEVNNLADVIHNIKVNQHGLNLDITDVGFGLSQILPVIVQGFLSQNHSLTIIEQPEIHLHPKMQAELADLFIDIISVEGPAYKGKSLLIETHSEYLLKRLRRRIAEKKIPAKNVAIYFIHPKETKNGSGKIRKIEISDTGEFEWPKDFYMSDLEDTIEFLKHQK